MSQTTQETQTGTGSHHEVEKARRAELEKLKEKVQPHAHEHVDNMIRLAFEHDPHRRHELALEIVQSYVNVNIPYPEDLEPGQDPEFKPNLKPIKENQP